MISLHPRFAKSIATTLATVNGRIKAMLKDGKKLADILAANPSAEYDEKWGKAFISPTRFIEMIVIAHSPSAAPATPAAK